MIFDPSSERWPPIYDAEDLQATIKELLNKGDIASWLYSNKTHIPHGLCQGDIIQLHTSVPLIDEDGVLAAKGDYKYWLILGNTCDFARDIEEVPWTQIVPIDLVNSSTDKSTLAALTKYQTTRKFYLPSWKTGLPSEHFVADFLRPVTIHKKALESIGKIQTRMTYDGWILFHSCLVRFFARDDGRFD